MNWYNVKFYFLASGMDGRAAEDDYGLVQARSKEHAITQVVDNAVATGVVNAHNKDFFRGCLTARKVKSHD